MSELKIAIHQPNFVPWFPFFYKMAMVDVFILFNHIQFEKNGYQNRFQYKDRWITKPVNNGVENISDKTYVSGVSLVDVNRKWIEAIAKTLDIQTMITDDSLLIESRSSDKTEKLIDIIKTQARYLKHDGELIYITSPDAKNKYLDEVRMNEAGIWVEYCRVPKNFQVSIFEMLETYGIEGTIRQLPKREVLV